MSVHMLLSICKPAFIAVTLGDFLPGPPCLAALLAGLSVITGVLECSLVRLLV